MLCLSAVATAQPAGGFGGVQQKERLETSQEWKDVNYVDDGQVYHNCDIYLPKQKKDSYPVVIHIYGSAWFNNNGKGQADLGTIVKSLLDAGYAVVCPNHRSSTDAQWPAQIHDIRAVVRFVRGEAKTYKFDPSFIATSGFSSGGHLASITATTSGIKTATVGTVTLDLEGNIGKYTDQPSYVNAACDWSGPVDLTAMDCGDHITMGADSPEDLLLKSKITKEPDKYLSLSATQYVSPNTPPIIIFHGEKDGVVPICQGKKFFELLKAAGVKTEAIFPAEGNHGGPEMYTPENLQKMVRFLNCVRKGNTTARESVVTSPNGQLVVSISDQGAHATSAISLNGQQVLRPSALGFKADFGDFTGRLSIVGEKAGRKVADYTMRQAKQSTIHYEASTLMIDFENSEKQHMSVEFFVKDHDVAFRYVIPRQDNNNPKCAVIERESTAFLLPRQTTTFVCPQIQPWTGWERSKPSYEEEYVPDAPINIPSKFGQGYTFPCLFRIPQSSQSDTWVLISETGVSSQYCGSHLSDYDTAKGYTIAFPQQGENNGVGSASAAITLPGVTPWRTITLDNSLKPIVETTISYDVVEPLYEPSEDYKSGRYTWSWLVWQDESINWDDQVQFINLASALGYEYCLVDGCWDTQIGRDRMPELSRYAQSKGVSLLLWYNSNGSWNDAPQTPRNRMNTAIARDQEMRWLKSIGVKGIKVDFFGGDKQETMRLYEDILSDANRYGLQVIFHGCTLPRGWERMYPNFVSSEAVLASENVYFTEHHAAQEPFQLTMHPFCRNAVATMDWGGIIMNRYMSRDNRSRHQRQTTNVFEMATAFTNQTAIQCVAVQPNNLKELSPLELDFLKQLPTTWEETRYIDGYPGRYVVLARRHGDHWYIAGLNAMKEPLHLTLDLSDFKHLSNIMVDALDKKTKTIHTAQQTLKRDKKDIVKVVLQPAGGLIIY